MLRRFLFLPVGLALMLGAAQARGATITDLYGTGVDNSHAHLAIGAADTHYTITASADPAAPAGSAPRVVNTSSLPYVSNTPTAQWVAPVPNAFEPNGTYDYRTSFTLTPGADLSSVLITGSLSSDDRVASVFLNGVALAITTPVEGYTQLHSFAINAALSPFFVSGTNTLTFRTENIFGAQTGLIVDMSGTFNVVPEPASMVLALSGIIGLVFIRRLKLAS
jgi:hypothetical protein